jgi:hypothetical protein
LFPHKKLLAKFVWEIDTIGFMPSIIVPILDSTKLLPTRWCLMSIMKIEVLGCVRQLVLAILEF